MVKQEIKHLVLVYGSLRVGFGNHSFHLSTSKFIEETTVDGFEMYSLGAFPYIKTDVNGKGVVVELFEVDDIVFASLDRLEGYPQFYNRKLVTTASGKEGWIYFIDNDQRPGPKVKSNDWKKYNKNHPTFF